jgi:NitT/TauT family transport system substrate-binding protein
LESINLKVLLCILAAAAIITLVGSLNQGWLLLSTANATDEPIRLGVKVWAPDFFSYLAQEKGFFEKNNVNVELTLVQDYLTILSDYMNGEFDGMIPVYTDVIFQNSEGIDSRVVYVIDYSNTGDVIIGNVSTIPENSNSSNTTLANVKGKKISVEGINSFSHLFVLKALETVGLGEGDVEFVNVPAQNVTRELDKGDIVAGHTYQPYTSEALRKGYKILFAAGDIPGVIADVLVFRTHLVEQRPLEIQSIIKSLIEAQRYYFNNEEESLKIMSSKSGVGIPEIRSGLESVTLPSLKENFNVAMKMNPNDKASLYASGNYISEFFLNRGQISENFNYNTTVDPRFVNALYEEDEKK